VPCSPPSPGSIAPPNNRGSFFCSNCSRLPHVDANSLQLLRNLLAQLRREPAHQYQNTRTTFAHSLRGADHTTERHEPTSVALEDLAHAGWGHVPLFRLAAVSEQRENQEKAQPSRPASGEDTAQLPSMVTFSALRTAPIGLAKVVPSLEPANKRPTGRRLRLTMSDPESPAPENVPLGF
jgi:hypothetical protein